MKCHTPFGVATFCCVLAYIQYYENIKKCLDFLFWYFIASPFWSTFNRNLFLGHKNKPLMDFPWEIICYNRKFRSIFNLWARADNRYVLAQRSF